MKNLFILLLLAFLTFFPACSDTGNQVDAETEAAVNAVAGEAIMISYIGMVQEVTFMPVDGVSPGISRDVVNSTPITGYSGVSISGSYDFSSASAFTANLDILFTNYTGSSGTINGTVNIDIDGDYSVPTFSLTTSGQLTALYNGSTYVMDFDFTVTINSTTVTASGYIQCNGYNIEFSYTEDLPT